MTTLEKALIGIVAFLVTSGAFAAWWAYHDHAEQKIGAAKAESKDTAALVVAKQEADAGTAANINQAAQADSEADHDQKTIDDYLRNHPVGAQRLCRPASYSVTLLPETGAAVASAPGTGARQPVIRPMPDGNAGADIGPGLDELVRSAARVATLDADRQRRDASQVAVK